MIGGAEYNFIVGSLDEPIAVDDKTGVELTVQKAGGSSAMHMSADGDMESDAAAVTGLEESLQVELIAADKKKTLPLKPAYGKPGSYTAAFYPTVATGISYRLFGTIDKVPVDITFTCRAEGADAANEGEKDLGGGVMQKSKTGGFGCPAEKASLGFPEASASIAQTAGAAGSARTYGMTGIALGAVALGFMLMRRKS